MPRSAPFGLMCSLQPTFDDDMVTLGHFDCVRSWFYSWPSHPIKIEAYSESDAGRIQAALAKPD